MRHISFRVSDHDRAVITAAAKHERRTISNFVHGIIQQYLLDHNMAVHVAEDKEIEVENEREQF